MQEEETFKKKMNTFFLLAQEQDFLLQEEDFLLQEEDLLAQEEALLLTQEEDKEWSPKKLKMVKKHFFPELSGDLWGVICYHHWYLRAGLEPQERKQQRDET